MQVIVFGCCWQDALVLVCILISGGLFVMLSVMVLHFMNQKVQLDSYNVGPMLSAMSACAGQYAKNVRVHNSPVVLVVIQNRCHYMVYLADWLFTLLSVSGKRNSREEPCAPLLSPHAGNVLCRFVFDVNNYTFEMLSVFYPISKK